MNNTYELIKFNGKTYLLLDRFEYKNKEYLYIIEDKSNELEKLKHVEDFEGNIEFNFITKCDDGQYENVVDNDLFQTLLKKVGLRHLKKRQ